MNGAESVIRTLHGGGVTLCFANPGTSEMHFVDALDRTGLMRCVLGLFEGVVSGAADGYARMAGTPAATLLHLAPGFANAGANLHNARKARTPIVNIVGDHAVRHLAYDAPLTADVAGAAAPFSDFVRVAQSAATIGIDAAATLAAARQAPGRVATLIAPADAGWDEGGAIADPLAPPAREPLDQRVLDAAVDALGEPGTLILAGGRLLESADSLALLEGLAQRTGATVVTPGSNRRVERGRGRANFQKVPFAVPHALELLAPFRRCILIEANEPVAFFAYPQKPSLLLPPDCTRIALAGPGGDGLAALAALADRVGAVPSSVPEAPPQSAPGSGPITPESLAAVLAAALPEGAIVADESVTVGRGLHAPTMSAPPHSWISITGGAIGIGPPLALGAAIACPDRPVVALQADGSAMYTIQALWTQAREATNVTTVILSNGGYEILKGELTRVGSNPGRSALDMLEISRPPLDFVTLARGMGVPGIRAEDTARLCEAIKTAVREPGPFLIEAMID